MCVTDAPDVCAAPVVASAARVTVHVVPLIAVTTMISKSMRTRNCDVSGTGTGNPADDATTSDVATADASAAKVVVAAFANSSVGKLAS